jgi:ketosteroid isomerase-like protein
MFTKNPETPISTSKPNEQIMKDEQIITVEQVEQIIRALDTAASQNDVEGAVAVFAQDATVESPVIPRLLNRKEGVCRGRDEIRDLVRALMRRRMPWGRHEPPLIRGSTVAIEYMRASSDSEQFSVDVIEIRDGKIQSLRAYLGWRAVMAFTGEGGGSAT